MEIYFASWLKDKCSTEKLTIKREFTSKLKAIMYVARFLYYFEALKFKFETYFEPSIIFRVTVILLIINSLKTASSV